jgi:hypothetical protein
MLPSWFGPGFPPIVTRDRISPSLNRRKPQHCDQRYDPYMSRAEEAARRAELAAAQARGESREAQKLIDEFVVAAKAKGIAPHPLRATLYGGQSVKTDKVGWYIRKNQSIAIGEDGSYYLLTVPGGWRERFSGVKLQPSPPPLVIGKGGKDGESGDLADFLKWRLEAGWSSG